MCVIGIPLWCLGLSIGSVCHEITVERDGHAMWLGMDKGPKLGWIHTGLGGRREGGGVFTSGAWLVPHQQCHRTIHADSLDAPKFESSGKTTFESRALMVNEQPTLAESVSLSQRSKVVLCLFREPPYANRSSTTHRLGNSKKASVSADATGSSLAASPSRSRHSPMVKEHRPHSPVSIAYIELRASLIAR